MSFELTQVQKEVLRAELTKFFSTGQAQKCEHTLSDDRGLATFRYLMPDKRVVSFHFNFSEGWEPPMSLVRIEQEVRLKVEVEGLFEEIVFVEYEPEKDTKTLIQTIINLPTEIRKAREKQEREVVKSAMNEFENALVGVSEEGTELVDMNIRPKKRNFSGVSS